MRTLHTSFRVSNLAASLDFYTALGYEQLGRVDLGANASLTMLKFPGEEVVTLELVHRPEDGPVDIGTGFSHIPVQVEDLAATLGQLSEARLRLGPVERTSEASCSACRTRRVSSDRRVRIIASSEVCGWNR